MMDLEESLHTLVIRKNLRNAHIINKSYIGKRMKIGLMSLGEILLGHVCGKCETLTFCDFFTCSGRIKLIDFP